MSGGSSALLMVTSAVCTLLTLAVDVALLIAVLTVVGKYRKDAVFVLASAAGLYLFGTLFGAVGYSLGTAAMARMSSSTGGGYERFYLFNSAMHVGSTLIFVSGTICMLVGIVKLVKPEPGSQLPGTMPS
ncbi:MAG: hypothetical protein JWM74_4867 [Myxococcaceae bacterium]|nr:hypothetical protein [Myxococcaceae bacterium]